MDGLLFFIPPLGVILVLVLIQLHWTRRAMAQFADRHGLIYTSPPLALFRIMEEALSHLNPARRALQEGR